MSRPSAPLVDRLRQVLQTRGVPASDLASRTQIAPARLDAILDGRDAMTVDELIVLSQALALQPDDLGIELDEPEGELPYDPPDSDVLHAPFGAVEAAGTDDLVDMLDPDGNQVRQLFEVGFGLGCTFFFQATTDQLQDSGIPAAVLKRYAGGEVPIQLDSAYHVYNEPVFSEESLTMKLSFDAIYTCTFPWSSIQRVAFFPEVPEPDDEPEVEEEPPSPSGGAPFLRLVE